MRRCIDDDTSFDAFADASIERAAAPTFGTVHTVTGAAGQWCNVFLDPSPFSWLQYSNTKVHGYTRAKARRGELTLEFVASNDRRILDSITIIKGNKTAGIAPRIRRNKSVTYEGEAVALA